mgnify:CR=1 FL=1
MAGMDKTLHIIGGGMAYTFFAAQGKTTGTSLLEPDYIDYAKKMLDEVLGALKA